MLYFIADKNYTLHNTGPWHPEQPARTLVIEKTLTEAGLKTPLNTLKPRLALEDEVLLCHSRPYFELVRNEVNTLKNSPIVTMLSTGDVPISSNSFDIALLATGGVLVAVDKIMNSPNSSVFCITRPPGHHACATRGMGFCLFNNVAIGARYAQQRYGLQRILIVDWDVHHGNGTQEIFYADPSVFYFSTHERDLYPGTGTESEVGEGPGKGFTLNCPIFPGAKSRLEVLQSFEVLLQEKMQIFQPELIFISAGFDAHEADPLGHFNLTDRDFFDLTKSVQKIAKKYSSGRIVSILEGGYNLTALASSVLEHAKGLG